MNGHDGSEAPVASPSGANALLPGEEPPFDTEAT